MSEPTSHRAEREAYLLLRPWSSSVSLSKIARTERDIRVQQVRTESHRRGLARRQGLIADLRAQKIVRCAEPDADLAEEIIILIDAVPAQALLHPDLMNPARQRHVVENLLRRIQRAV